MRKKNIVFLVVGNVTIGIGLGLSSIKYHANKKDSLNRKLECYFDQNGDGRLDAIVSEPLHSRYDGFGVVYSQLGDEEDFWKNGDYNYLGRVPKLVGCVERTSSFIVGGGGDSSMPGLVLINSNEGVGNCYLFKKPKKEPSSFEIFADEFRYLVKKKLKR